MLKPTKTVSELLANFESSVESSVDDILTYNTTINLPNGKTVFQTKCINTNEVVYEVIYEKNFTHFQSSSKEDNAHYIRKTLYINFEKTGDRSYAVHGASIY